MTCADAELTIRCDPTALADVRQRVRGVAEPIGFADQDVSNIMLAVDEAIANVIRHGYGGPCDEPINIRIQRVSMDEAAAIQITIRDFGKQVEPDCIVGRSLDEVRPGGLGVHIIRTVMDDVVYSPADDRGMRLVMRKKYVP
ncbi:MAG: ATP-binding protein [Phycisphaerales bacterium]|nr:ATP-binding protein [Phycisphaerales bacterium]